MSMQVWSFTLTIIGFAATILQIRKNRHGWSVAILCQALWLAYAIMTSQAGFILGVVINACFSVYGLISWSKKSAPEPQPV